jgi:hypothetical protein
VQDRCKSLAIHAPPAVSLEIAALLGESSRDRLNDENPPHDENLPRIFFRPDKERKCVRAAAGNPPTDLARMFFGIK